MLFDRTFHPDEANQALTTGHLLETGQYAYRPDDHHGPTLYYAAAALQKVAGHDTLETMDGSLLRCTPLLFAVLALLFGFLAVRKLMKPIAGFLGWLVPGLFVLLLGTSPIFAFFATDFIQEMLLACFTLMMFWAGVGYLHAPKAGQKPQETKLKPGTWALFFGTATSLAFATKETCVLAFAAAAFAAAPFLAKRLTADALRARARDIVLAVLGFLIVACVLYSDFGRDFHGVYNAFVAAPLSYLGRAAGSAASAGAADHVHPWWQHFEWLFADKYGTLSFFAVCGAGMGLFARFGWLAARPDARARTNPALHRAFLFTLGYAALLLLFYSLIPYKTPWCTLQIHTGILLASLLGFAVCGDVFMAGNPVMQSSVRPTTWKDAFVWLRARPRLLKVAGGLPLVIAAILLLLGNGRDLIRMNRDPDSKDIPYNYASASPEVPRLAAAVADAMESGTNREPQTTPFTAVILPASDTWPFPWYNRLYRHRTGYWSSFDGFKQNAKALADSGFEPTVLIVPKEDSDNVQSFFPYLEQKGCFHMRRGVKVALFTANMQVSPEITQLAATVSAAMEAAAKQEPKETMPFIALALPPADAWIFALYNREYARETSWVTLDDLSQLAADGITPSVVIVRKEEGHKVNNLFPRLNHWKCEQQKPPLPPPPRFYIRGTRNKEGKMRGVCARVFW